MNKSTIIFEAFNSSVLETDQADKQIPQSES